MNRNPLFLLPILVVLAFGVVLGYKWWNAQTSNIPKPQGVLTEGISVDDNSQALLKRFGIPEKRVAQLKSVGRTEGYGVVQWSEDRRLITVLANLPQLQKGSYQAWMIIDGSSTLMGTMRIGKGGYVVDYTSPSQLPEVMTVVVSQEVRKDNILEEKVLEGVVNMGE
ncbi:MAG: hypothetical protein HZA34_02825 [Candidatus Pacebacteria bacterium]|nr:hypothetical protein [Candidatus Paceibacterota bacterium]